MNTTTWSREARQAATDAVLGTAPALTGTERQVAWAQDIRSQVIRALAQASASERVFTRRVAKFLAIRAAAWWLDRRDLVRALSDPAWPEDALARWEADALAAAKATPESPAPAAPAPATPAIPAAPAPQAAAAALAAPPAPKAAPAKSAGIPCPPTARRISRRYPADCAGCGNMIIGYKVWWDPVSRRTWCGGRPQCQPPEA
jgi:hypothetical protein